MYLQLEYSAGSGVEPIATMSAKSMGCFIASFFLQRMKKYVSDALRAAILPALTHEAPLPARVPCPNRMWNNSQAAQKGPDARRRPPAAREAYFLYVERAAKGANCRASEGSARPADGLTSDDHADGPFSAA